MTHKYIQNEYISCDTCVRAKTAVFFGTSRKLKCVYVRVCTQPMHLNRFFLVGSA